MITQAQHTQHSISNDVEESRVESRRKFRKLSSYLSLDVVIISYVRCDIHSTLSGDISRLFHLSISHSCISEFHFRTLATTPLPHLTLFVPMSHWINFKLNENENFSSLTCRKVEFRITIRESLHYSTFLSMFVCCENVLRFVGLSLKIME